MEPQRLTASKEFYDELWSDLLSTYYGIQIKPFISKHTFSWTNPQKPLKEGFLKQKPSEFYETDFIFIRNNNDYKLTVLADNRMMMGDYRYGSIHRQNLNNYDTRSEFFRRLRIAKDTKNLEYIVDAYNMLRIQYFKSKNINEYKDLLRHHLYIIIEKANKEKWELISIDDGIHATEK